MKLSTQLNTNVIFVIIFFFDNTTLNLIFEYYEVELNELLIYYMK